MKKTEKSLMEEKCSKSSKHKNVTIENLIYEYELNNDIKLLHVSSKKFISENGNTFIITKTKGVVEIEKQFERINDLYYKCLNIENKYFNIIDKNYYFKDELINDFGDEVYEYRKITDKIEKDKLLSFFNDCLHYLMKIIKLYEKGEKSIKILSGEIDGKHNDLYVISCVNDYNLLPNFKGGDCNEHIIGRMNVLLYLLNEISEGSINNLQTFRNEVNEKSKFIRTPSTFNTEIAKYQNNKNFDSTIYLNLLKQYCNISKEDETNLKKFIDNNKINITKKSVIINIIRNMNYLKHFIQENIYEN